MEVGHWMSSNRLKLNADKTELLRMEIAKKTLRDIFVAYCTLNFHKRRPHKMCSSVVSTVVKILAPKLSVIMEIKKKDYRDQFFVNQVYANLLVKIRLTTH